MKLHCFRSGLLGVNSYFLINEQTKECVVIDSGEYFNKITQVADSLGVKIKAILLTHAHFDHSLNAYTFQQNGVKIYASEKEAEKLKVGDNLGEMFRKPIQAFCPDVVFSDGEEFTVCDIKFKAIITPGHTDGSTTFVVSNMLFTGDTLLNQSIGRTDFPTGDYFSIMTSIKRLYENYSGYEVYPGHGDSTSIDFEKVNNPFIKL